MKLHDFLGNTKSKTEMLLVISCIVCPVKTVENRSLLFVRDSGAIIRYRKIKMFASLRKRKEYVFSGRNVREGIVKENRQYLGNSGAVALACGKRFVRKRNMKSEFFLLHQPFIFFEGIQKKRVKFARSGKDSPGVVICICDGEHISNEPRHSVSLIFYNGSKVLLFLGGSLFHSLNAGKDNRKR